jgi:hypothetical protein
MITPNATAVAGENSEGAKLVNKKKIADRYGVSERMIQDLMLTGLPFYKLGYIVRFDPTQCDKFMEKFRNDSDDN